MRHIRPSAPFIPLLLFVLVVGTAGRSSQAPADSFDLPDIGSSAGTLMSPAEERQLGREFMKWLRKALEVSDDPLLTDYIQSLGKQLAAASGEGSGNYDFFIVDDPTINAFAGPSGHIGVNAGLILAAETESELAAVVAHEIAHVSQDHLLRRFESQKQMSIPTIAMMLAAAAIGAALDPQAGVAAMMGVQGMAAQQQINFTRANEEEADRIGIETLARAGHDPYAMPGFFQKLTRATRIYESGAPELLRTHPVTTDRIADAVARADQYGHRQQPDSLRFHLTRADLRQRNEYNPQRAVDRFEDTLSRGRYRNELAERYGYALALLRAGRTTEAAAQTQKLLASHPSQVEFVVLQARIDRQNGNAAKAARDLKGSVGLAPGNWPLRQAYAEALLDAGRPKEALNTLEGFVALRPGIAQIYRLMADAAGKSGRRTDTLRWRAEALYAEGDLEPAIRQLELALRQPNIDFHLASRIQVRLDELQAEQRTLDKKERARD
ncbi:M48 family metallopeptidase [Thiohalocapsa marina]|uniref:Putative beta-barrel assembly-enhancing protease n=1 Tax=Thiohalocapsa marina TaxID=424902 RepID=A0A5M8FL82_9GAMM|nr:M48 family metalloprotease [Thiohalocapsa marina]KAA6185477.1 M48 family metallopeptidase [Thiohalocapsa marina]